MATQTSLIPNLSSTAVSSAAGRADQRLENIGNITKKADTTTPIVVGVLGAAFLLLYFKRRK